MKEKKYLVYLDILGFEGLAKEIANGKGIEERSVRKTFIDIIKEKVGIIETKGKITGEKYGESDDWLLVMDSLYNVFASIFEILEHSTGYKGYEKIPLEIAIEIGKYVKWAKFDGKNLIFEEDTIKFLKTNIINYYRKWYKEKNNQSPKSTFIILTESAYQELDHLDKKICKQISYKENGKEITFFVADINRVQQRGKVFEFLEKIGHARSKWYERIDEVYVPPFEYEVIKKILKEKRIVFITGTPEYGKTYTAVRLMWEYYNRGYEPRWITGGEKYERLEARKKLEDIGAELRPQHIIYFEDPFGKKEYEIRESLEREIGTIIESVKRAEDAYVVITSREEVFKEFEKENLSAKDLKEFEKKLNIKKPSYSYRERKEILSKWAEEKGCRWLNDSVLRDLVFEKLTQEKLPTPLNIKDFAIASKDIIDKEKLQEKIDEKSEETAMVFAKEIENMTDDKVLFLSLLFALHKGFSTDFIEENYTKLVNELGIKNPKDFNEILEWFIEDKINISEMGLSVREFVKLEREKIETVKDLLRDSKFRDWRKTTWLDFAHPSYLESLKYILQSKDNKPTRINKEIFSPLLLKLSESDATAIGVALTIRENFDQLPEDVRNKLLFKLFKLSDKKDVAAWDLGLIPNITEIATTIGIYFDKLPEDVSNLLFKLSEKDGAAAVGVARAVGRGFNKLPEDVRNKLLHKLSEKDTAAWDVAWIIAHNFDKLPEDVRNLLDRLQKSLQEVIKDLLKGEFLGWFDIIEALHLISNALPKIDQDFVLKILDELNEWEDELIRMRAVKIRNAIYLLIRRNIENG